MRRKIYLPLILILVAAYGGLIATLVSGHSPELGLDLQGGVSVVLAPADDASADQLDQSVEIIRDRVDALGVAEPDITTQGDAIVVQLPGVKNRDRALALVGQTAELQFRPVLQQGEFPADDVAAAQEEADAQVSATTSTTAPADPTASTTVPADPTASTTSSTPTTVAPDAPDEGAWAPPAGGALVEGESAAGPAQDPTATTVPTDPTATTVPTDPTATTVPGEAAESTEQPVPPLTPRDQDLPEQPVTLAGKPVEDSETTSVYSLGPALASGRIVATARADIQNGQWFVSLEMRGGEDGIDRFNEIATTCYVQNPDPTLCPTGQLAIVLDSVVQTAPRITEPAYGAEDISISGEFDEGEAKDLALVLRYGSLPVELERQSVQTVSASLGDDSLRAGIIAGAVGLAIVALYMLVYYRALGLVVIVGLSVWGALMYTIITFLGHTWGLALTLSGVTGIIVSIGVTVDSYVVYFERLKDEVKAGRTLRTSTDRAFKRAFRTVLAANFTAFLGALVLWWLTVGSVRGFAFFLGLSTLLDVVVAWAFTHPVVVLLSRNRVFTDMPFLGVARGLAAPRAPADEGTVAVTGAGR